MDDQLNIERILEEISQGGNDFYQKYILLKKRLTTIDYANVGANFEGGNDHGPRHIQRVLEKLNRIVGNDPLRDEILSPYELFLTMMSILYHDLGMLRGRDDHPLISALLLDMDSNTYVFDTHEKDIIKAAIVSHGSKMDINITCARLGESMQIGNFHVRPKVIAALTRFSDELDEDYRRADQELEKRLDIPEESIFYWRFCQRITGISPDFATKTITVNVKFEDDDIGRVLIVGGESKPFLSAYANKLSKINKERIYVNNFLPNSLKYNLIKVSVMPPTGQKEWTSPRDYLFDGSAEEHGFVRRYPELLDKYVTDQMSAARTEILNYRLDEAEEILSPLLPVAHYFQQQDECGIYYIMACNECLLAQKEGKINDKATNHLEQAIHYLEKWVQKGLSSAWKENGEIPENEIHKMGKDNHLHFVFKHFRDQLLKVIPNYLHTALPKKPPRKLTKKELEAGGGGCVPPETKILCPEGSKLIRDLKVGDKVLSLDIANKSSVIETTVTEVHTSRQPHYMLLNGCYILTPSQPVLTDSNRWILAGELKSGMKLKKLNAGTIKLTKVEKIEESIEVNSITTNHSSHNFIAYDMICHNKMPLWLARSYFK